MTDRMPEREQELLTQVADLEERIKLLERVINIQKQQMKGNTGDVEFRRLRS